MAKTLRTPKGRVSFPKVYRAEAFNDGDKPKFSLTLIFEPDADLSELKAAAAAAAKAKWPDGPPKDPKTPFIDGDTQKGEECHGKTLIRLSNETRPRIVSTDMAEGGVFKDIPEGSGRFYAGCYAHASCTCYAWEHKNKSGAVLNCGVSFGLLNIKKLDDGEPFSGHTVTEAEQDFAGFESPAGALPDGGDLF